MNRWFYYDRDFKRLWCAGVRVHHGAVGLVLLGVGLALTLHDFKDRHIWFEGRS